VGRILIVMLLFLSSIVDAQVGTWQRVIDSAKKNEEPPYIQDLMVRLSGRLYAFAQRKQIHSPTQKLAWFHTMHGVIGFIREAVSFIPDGVGAYCGCTGREATCKALKNTARRAAEDSAEKAARKIPNGVWSEARKVASDAICPNTVIPGLFYSARGAAGDAAGEVYKCGTGSSYDETGSIATRVAEWVVLNALLGYTYRDQYDRKRSDPTSFFLVTKKSGYDIHAILEHTYPAVLAALGDHPEENPFESNEKTIGFMKSYFGHLTPNEMVFLAPWLGQIVSLDQVPEIHRPIFQSMWPFSFPPWSKVAPISTALPLPSEVTRLILFYLRDLSLLQGTNS